MATRHEKVVLSLQDEFSSEMTRAAATTALLDKQLDSLSKRAVVTSRSQATVARDIDRTGASARRAAADIDRYSGRLRVLADVAAIGGPTLAPIGAVGVGLLGGLVNQMSVAVLAGGSLVAAFQGVGTALEAVNKAALEPTAENLAAATDEMGRLSPAARDAVNAMRDFTPLLKDIRDAGATGLMPGFIESLESISTRGDDMIRIVGTLNQVVGDLMSDGASALASDGWDDFFNFLAADSAQTLASMGVSMGNLAKGFSELWMAFDPLSDGFNSWLEGASEGFAKWAAGLSESERFQDFVDYIFQSGPQVTSSLTALADAMLAVLEAASPLGGPVLAALESVAEAVATIARSDIGTPIMAGVAALALFNRTMAVGASLSAGGGMFGILGGTAAGKSADRSRSAIQGIRKDFAELTTIATTAGRTTEREWSRTTSSLKSNLGEVARGTAGAATGLALFGASASGAADEVGLSNTAMGAMFGMLGGPWGMAIGAGVGGLMDLAGANDDVTESSKRLREALAAQAGSATTAEVEALTAALEEQRAKVAELTDVTENSGETAASSLKNLSNEMSGWFDGSTDLEDLNADLKASTEELARLESEARRLSALDLEAQQWTDFAGAVELSSEATQTAIAGFIGLGDSVNDAEVSLGEWLGQLEAQRTALADFRDNAIEAGEKGVSEGLIKHLQELGPEGALRMKELADGTVTEARRATRAFEGLTAEGEAYGAFIEGLPNEVATRISQTGMPKSLEDIRSLAIRYDLTPEEINTLVALSGVEAASNALDNLTRTRTATVRVTTGGATILPSQTGYSSGGWTGPGGKYEPAGIVHADEFVVRKEARQSLERVFPGLLDHLNATGALPGYASGGSVGLTARGTKAKIDSLGSQGYLDWLEENKRNRASKLEILRQEQRIKDLQKSLAEKEKNKDGKATGRNEIRGLDRKVAEEELKVARRELKELEASRTAPTKMNALDRRILAGVERGKQNDLADIERQLAGDGPFGQAIKDATSGIELWQGKLQDSERALADWQSKADSVGQSAVSGFQADLWATSTPSNVWAAGQMKDADPIAALGLSTAGLKERQSLMDQTSAAGITGDAFGALMTGSNADIASLIKNGRLGEFSQAFTENQAVRQSVSQSAGQYAYGSQIAGARQEVALNQQSVDFLVTALEGLKDSDSDWRDRSRDLAQDIRAALVTPAAAGAYR